MDYDDLQPGEFKLAGDVSSQFVTGLLFALPLLKGDSFIRFTSPLESKGYVEMTRRVLVGAGIFIGVRDDGYDIPGGQTYHAQPDAKVEGDWSGAAFWFAVQIEVMVAVADGRDIIAMTTMEFFVMGLVNLLYGVFFEPAPALEVFRGGDFWMAMGYLTILSACVCTVFQNVGQAHVPPAQASLLLSLESVFGVLFSVLFFGEELTLQLALGFTLVFCAILLSELAPRRT